MQDVLEKVQVNVPFRTLVNGYFSLFLEKRINPEIGFDCFALDNFTKNDFTDAAGRLKDKGLSITLHAPFFDLRPGAIDERIREASIERLRYIFDIAPYFEPKSIVFHAAFDEKYYISNEERWLENSIKTWSQFLEIALDTDTLIAIENTYEKSPRYLKLLLDYFAENPRLCSCFDTGHCNAFSDAPLEEWIKGIGSHIGQIHVHDNNGLTDQHAPVGDGSFPFVDFFKALKEMEKSPIITLEPHNEAHLWRTLKNIKDMKLLEFIG
jgi:sugar phosphate isomerase/epimerase